MSDQSVRAMADGRMLGLSYGELLQLLVQIDEAIEGEEKEAVR